MSLPMTKVVVMEDRAQVERAGAVVVSGTTKIELTGLSPVAVDRSLRVDVHGATFVDARFERRWKEQPRGGLGANASELRKKVKALEDAVRATKDDVSRAETRVELLATARGDLLRSISEGTGVGKTDVPGWGEQLATLSTRQAESDERLRLAREELARETKLHEQAWSALSLSEEAVSTLECTLIITLEGQGSAQVRVTYLVPCAVWRPTYRASLTGTSVLLEAEATIWQRTGEDWVDVQVQLSTARPTLGTTPPGLAEDCLRTRPKLQEEKRVVDVSIREEVIQKAGESGTSELPGLDDGGEARLLDVPAKTTLVSNGQPHRLSLFSFRAKAEFERVCAAELTSTVSLVGRFPNESGHVLLAGPIDLVRQSGFVGRSQLRFAAPGEQVRLSFGTEDGLQVVRSVDEKVDEARLTGRRTTTKKVTLHVSNARSDAAKLIIEERVPVSEVKEVEVQVVSRDCSPAPSPLTKDGIARLEFELPPNGTRTAKFTWELSAAAKVAGV